ncbi:MAG: primosomal protein N' [Parcubacteria group bacterium]|nr:primosomal protein N' [Parcubacteria group bacterium]
MPNKIVNVIPATNIPPDKNQVFSYLAPEKEELQPGQEVLVPLRNRQVRAIVAEKPITKKLPYQVKPVTEIFPEKNVLTPAHLQLAKWVAEYYQTSLGLVIKTMLWPRLKRTKKTAVNSAKITTKFPRLTSDQAETYKPVGKALKAHQYQSFLLHGVTGSGKTEIYMRAIQEVLKKDKQTILLVPEISLTPQNIERFAARFGADKLAILHSKMTGGEKYTEWQKIISGQAKIIIGPRSAIFAPTQNLGLIIIDEEHDASYKQYDQQPRYHARETALKLAEFTQSVVILGSATPSLESYYNAKTKKHTLLELPQRYAGGLELPKVEIVDMRQEIKKRNYSIFSEKLAATLEKVLAEKKQALLFINRRGASTFVMCRDCGYVVECPNCSVSLTYHLQSTPTADKDLICHHCNYQTSSPTLCPECDSQFIKYFGTGTQKVEHELQKLFPAAKIARADRDSMDQKDAHQQVFHNFSSGEYDILIGTQMITKGWDLPNVDLVGIISADVLFNFPDFRSNERAFQIITQVAGRTGRGQKRGQVILQTYNPKNAIIKAAAQHDYHKFYQAEIKERQALNYPPYSQLVKIICQHRSAEKVQEQITALAKTIKQVIIKNKQPIEILGPAPAFFSRVRNRYRWNIICKIKGGLKKSQRDIFTPAASQTDCIVDIDPEDLL